MPNTPCQHLKKSLNFAGSGFFKVLTGDIWVYACLIVGLSGEGHGLLRI
jgi:hypothetical protein